MAPYDAFLLDFKVTSYPELYAKLNTIAREKMGLNGVPFSLAALQYSKYSAEIFSFINQVQWLIGMENKY